MERTVSIQEFSNKINMHRPFGVIIPRQYQKNLVIKKVTFDTLRKYVVNLVDQYLKTLKLIAEAVICMVQKVCDQVKTDASLKTMLKSRYSKHGM